jgi:hypothetical protein
MEKNSKLKSKLEIPNFSYTPFKPLLTPGERAITNRLDKIIALLQEGNEIAYSRDDVPF